MFPTHSGAAFRENAASLPDSFWLLPVFFNSLVGGYLCTSLPVYQQFAQTRIAQDQRNHLFSKWFIHSFSKWLITYITYTLLTVLLWRVLVLQDPRVVCKMCLSSHESAKAAVFIDSSKVSPRIWNEMSPTAPLISLLLSLLSSSDPALGWSKPNVSVVTQTTHFLLILLWLVGKKGEKGGRVYSFIVLFQNNLTMRNGSDVYIWFFLFRI